jgi:HEAT repeat protein
VVLEVAVAILVIGLGSLLALLISQRVITSAIARHRERRTAALVPLVLGALDTPERVGDLERALRRGDHGVLRHILLRLALDLRGDEREAVAHLYQDLGFIASELRRLRSPSARRRAAAAAHLGILRHRASAPALVAAMADRDPLVRLAAVRAAGEVGGDEATAALVQALGDARPSVSRRALEILAEHGRTIVDEVLAFAASTPSRAGRLAAIELLGLLRAPQAVPLLREAIASTDPDERIKATKAAAAIGDPRLLDSLHALLADGHWEVRCQAARGLGLLGSAASIPFLQSALGDDQWWVRFRAGIALAEIAGPPGLEAALAEHADPGARDIARYLLVHGTALPAIP